MTQLVLYESTVVFDLFIVVLKCFAHNFFGFFAAVLFILPRFKATFCCFFSKNHAPIQFEQLSINFFVPEHQRSPAVVELPHAQLDLQLW